MNLTLDDGTIIPLESIKTTEAYPNSTVVVKVKDLIKVNLDYREKMRAVIQMAFFPARAILVDKDTDIEVVEYEKNEPNKKVN